MMYLYRSHKKNCISIDVTDNRFYRFCSEGLYCGDKDSNDIKSPEFVIGVDII